jgi:hypothetical protein
LSAQLAVEPRRQPNGGSRLDHQSTGVVGVIGLLPYGGSCIIK